MKTLTVSEWRAEAARRYGADAKSWRFRCPACGHVASVADWDAAGAPEGAVAFSCVGRYIEAGAPREAFLAKGGPGPCTYAGGGLFKLNPVTVLPDGTAPGDRAGAHSVFDFADDPIGARGEAA